MNFRDHDFEEIINSSAVLMENLYYCYVEVQWQNNAFKNIKVTSSQSIRTNLDNLHVIRTDSMWNSGISHTKEECQHKAYQ